MGEGNFDEIQGEVAGPFRTFVDNVNDRLQSLPDVSSTASTIFADHAGRLDDYRTAADKALASAITKWSERKSVAGQLDAASDAEAKAKTKVDSTPPDADPTATSDAQDAHDQAAQHVTDVKNKLAGIDGELKQFRAKWNELRGDEKDLQRRHQAPPRRRRSARPARPGVVRLVLRGRRRLPPVGLQVHRAGRSRRADRRDRPR